MNTQLTERKCKFCGVSFPQASREDKVFCGDTCRNNFNKQKNAEEKLPAHENRSEIVKIIKRNYEFLRKHAPRTTEPDVYNYIETQGLKEWQDFNPKFYTSTKLIHNTLWYFCFDLGFSIGDTTIEIINLPEQANLN